MIRPGARKRSLYLPEGRWVDFWRAVAYQPDTGGFRLDRAGAPRAAVTGGRELTLDAPLEELPMFVRAGAVLPLLPPDVDTLAEVGAGDGLVKLGDRQRRMHLLAFPRGSTLARLAEGERIRSHEARRGPRRWTLKVAGSRKREYALQASLSTLRKPFRPCSVTLGGRELRRGRGGWSYVRRTRVVRVRFAAKRATLVVKACGS